MPWKFRRTHLISATALLLAGFAAWVNLDGLAVRFGGTFGITVSKHTFWLPRAIKLGLSEPVPEATAGPLVWTIACDGFEIAWLDVQVGGSTIDGIALARIDPSRHRFSVLQEPNGKKHLEDWMHDTGAELIVNASYYDRKGEPATPVVDRGVVSGPADYRSQHGAFVVKAPARRDSRFKDRQVADLFQRQKPARRIVSSAPRSWRCNADREEPVACQPVVHRRR